MRNLTSRISTNTLTSMLTVVGLISALASTPATAAKFGVKIVNESGQAVEGAAVCIGMPGSYRQFGSKLTDESGLAMLEVPRVPFVVTVSKDRVGGMAINEPARGFNLIKQVTLKEGSHGATCNVKGEDTVQSSVRISSVDVSDNPYATTLTPSVVGEPNQYRVSRTSSFSDAKWQRFETSIPLTTSLSAANEVFVQMRKYKSVNKGWIEARSEAVNVQLITFE